MKPTLNDVCDYVIFRVCNGGSSLTELKLQKLLYYVQAWHLAFFGEPLFVQRFQAWVHGPVCRAIYDRFGATKSLYSTVTLEDIHPEFKPASVAEQHRAHIDSVLEVYAGFTGTQLEEMTHQEGPWIAARRGYGDAQRCEIEIDEQLMRQHYTEKFQASQPSGGQ